MEQKQLPKDVSQGFFLPRGKPRNEAGFVVKVGRYGFVDHCVPGCCESNEEATPVSLVCDSLDQASAGQAVESMCHCPG